MKTKTELQELVKKLTNQKLLWAYGNEYPKQELGVTTLRYEVLEEELLRRMEEKL